MSITKGNKVLDVEVYNVDGFLWSDTCGYSIQHNMHIWNKRAYLHLEKSKLQEVFLSKTSSVFTGKQWA
jgi:hypothetical protein